MDMHCPSFGQGYGALDTYSSSYHLYAPNPCRLEQELAPFPPFADGCQWVIEPVSRHFFINQDLFEEELICARTHATVANIGCAVGLCKFFCKKSTKLCSVLFAVMNRSYGVNLPHE